jgi:hypothetical protein
LNEFVKKEKKELSDSELNRFSGRGSNGYVFYDKEIDLD